MRPMMSYNVTNDDYSITTTQTTRVIMNITLEMSVQTAVLLGICSSRPHISLSLYIYIHRVFQKMTQSLERNV